MRFPQASFLIATVTVAACQNASGRGDDLRWEAVVDTVGDTITVRTVAGSVWGDTAELEPEMSIGVLDGPDEYMLGRVRSLALAPTGDIYLADQQVPVVRKVQPRRHTPLRRRSRGGRPWGVQEPGWGFGRPLRRQGAGA